MQRGRADEGDPEVRDIINSAHSILYPMLCAIRWLVSPSPAAVRGSGSSVSQHNALGRTGVPLEERSSGRAAGWGPGLLAARFFSEPHAHRRDEGSPLATAIF